VREQIDAASESGMERGIHAASTMAFSNAEEIPAQYSR
jgi:hypothetical protein